MMNSNSNRPLKLIFFLKEQFQGGRNDDAMSNDDAVLSTENFNSNEAGLFHA